MTRKEKIIKFKGNISQAVADDRISSSCACQIMDEFDAILALQIEVPSEEEISDFGNEEQIRDYMPETLKLHIKKKNECRIEGAKWAINKTIERNKKCQE
jgi:hypothetical protein